MTDHPYTQPDRPERLEFHHPIAVVRGLLADALTRVDPDGAAAGEICEVWLELDEPGNPTVGHDDDDEGVVPAEVILAMARDVLHAALVTVTSDAGAASLFRALGHLDAAAAFLRVEAALSGGATW